MKKIIKGSCLAVCVLALSSMANASSNAVQDFSSEGVQLAHHGGYYHSAPRYNRSRYVCYDHKYFINQGGGHGWWKYNGCVKANSSCGSIGKTHFGKYSSYGAQSRAFSRCHRSTPRFVD